MNTIPPLFDHQRKSIEFIRTRPRVFDASDPGTGKTRVAIEAYAERRMRGGGKALILAPKTLLKSAWAADFARFSPDLRTSVAYAENRDAAFWREADIYITNHDAVVWLAKQKTDFFDNFDTLIVDEVGAFKHNTSKRSKALNRVKQYFTHRLVLNGTPTPNSVTEIWNQMYVLDDGKRLGPSFFNFRSTVCTPKQVGPQPNMLKWEDRPGASDAVTALIEDITIRHVFEECVDIPENHEYFVPYSLTARQQHVYDQIEKAQVSVIDTTVISAVNAAVVAAKLLQISSGAVYNEQGEYKLLDIERYEVVMDLAMQRQNTVIFFLWRHQKDQLIEQAKLRGLTYCVIDGTVNDASRTMAVDLYQKGFYRVCFAHPQSAAHGLTLTRGSATIWASPTYNLEHYQQGSRRIYRAGQKNRTETITVIAKNTIEEHVWTALQNKRVRMTDLLQQLKG